ncbi:uncharacterized protein M437DRAFT_70495 [Aureobasidium melanogenum CBS 110374]|uniref:Uncharacterized protein n=2 Tax=Aureobasidium melanogenum TaxID=46634 RepID=A0A074W5J3_AURM1
MERTCDEQATCLPQTAAELLDRTVCLHGWVAWDHASATHGADGRSTLSSVTYRCDRLEMSSEITPTNSEDYTVAWIAALPHERAAGEMMLDHEYVQPKSFTKNVNDPNRYSWGWIGEHLVVIASLPAGEYGT